MDIMTNLITVSSLCRMVAITWLYLRFTEAAFVSNSHQMHHAAASKNQYLLHPSNNAPSANILSHHRHDRSRWRDDMLYMNRHCNYIDSRRRKFSTSSLHVGSLRDIIDDGTQHFKATSSLSPKAMPSPIINGSNNNNNIISSSDGLDIKTMGAAEIMRELQSYGVNIADYSFHREKRELEEALLKERQLCNPSVSSHQQQQQQSRQQQPKESKTWANSVMARMRNGKPSSPASSSYTSTTSSSNTAPPNQKHHQTIPATQLNAHPTSSTSDTPTENEKEQSKLRDLQIAYEFERVQAALPTPADIQHELETKFSISTKYFLGIKEMAYALAVARVDDMLERQKMGLLDEGCIIGDDDDDDDNAFTPKDGNYGECNEDEMLPTPDELISMEYENLQPWDEVSLSEELENQYGIPAKHFMGKKEMAYALAVERVDRAMKEGGLIMDDYEEDTSRDAVMTEEDMMRMMEEEMRKEEEEERQYELEKEQQQVQQHQQEAQQQTIGGTTSSIRDTQKSVRDSPSAKRNFGRDPNPFQKKSPSQGPSYQSTPLADMLKNDKRSKDRTRHQQRTPLSSEPPLGRQRSSSGVQMGSVIGDNNQPSTAMPIKETKSLSDFLKGAERPRGGGGGRGSPSMGGGPGVVGGPQRRSRATTPPPRRSRATTPPPPRKMPEPPPRSRRKFTKTTAHIDDSFQGHNTSWNKGPINSSGYTSTWNKPPPHQAATAGSGGPTPRQAATGGGGGYTSSWNKPPPHQAATTGGGPTPHQAAPGGGPKRNSSSRVNSSGQRPFEPAPFTEPGAHNSGASASSNGRGPKRVPPQTPFTTDGTQATKRGPNSQGPFTPFTPSQGPFTPFTPPGKRSTNGKPPPSRKRSQYDTRGFNMKDTPDNTQPFMGSQTYVYPNDNVFSPPLQVEPPPPDPNYVPPERPFEPTPFSNPQPHSVRTDRTASPRDKWNRVDKGGSTAFGNGVPPPSDNGAYRTYNQQSQAQRKSSKQETKRHRTGSSSPFDNLKDMFNTMGGNNKKKAEVVKEETAGFKSGNVEVFSGEENEWQSPTTQQSVNENNIIDAELWDGDEESVWEEEERQQQQQQQMPSAGRFSNNAWMGGPAPSDTTTTMPYYANANGEQDSDESRYDSDSAAGGTIENELIERAQHLLTTNPAILEIVTRAQSNPKVREAVHECMGNPVSFGLYLDDPEVGPLLNELKESIS